MTSITVFEPSTIIILHLNALYALSLSCVSLASMCSRLPLRAAMRGLDICPPQEITSACTVHADTESRSTLAPLARLPLADYTSTAGPARTWRLGTPNRRPSSTRATWRRCGSTRPQSSCRNIKGVKWQHIWLGPEEIEATLRVCTLHSMALRRRERDKGDDGLRNRLLVKRCVELQAQLQR